MISEAKMKIVIDNYFKSECNVGTSIRQAFEKGFRIGVQKGIILQSERKNGVWIPQKHSKTNGMVSTTVYYYPKCSVCGQYVNYTNFCPNCGADMNGD